MIARLLGASSATSYPTDSGYDGSGYNDNTATYVKTARGEGWTNDSSNFTASSSPRISAPTASHSRPNAAYGTPFSYGLYVLP